MYCIDVQSDPQNSGQELKRKSRKIRHSQVLFDMKNTNVTGIWILSLYIH